MSPGCVRCWTARTAPPSSSATPAWYLIAAGNEAIPPCAECQFADRMGATTLEVLSGRLAMVSHPDGVTALIERAARDVQAAN